MSSLSIRGIDKKTSQLLKSKAKDCNKSVNQFVLDVLKKSVGLAKEKQYTEEYDDLDHFFGKWAEDHYHSIQGKIDEERGIDQELWK